MSKKFVKSHIKRAFQTAMEIYAYNQAQEAANKENFDSAVKLFEQLSGMKFNINDQLVDDSELENYEAPVSTNQEYKVPTEVAVTTVTEPAQKYYTKDMSLTDKIVFVVEQHGKLSRAKIVEELLKLEPEMDDKKINATFYSMVQRNIITSPVGYNGEVSINPERPEKKKKGKKMKY